MTNTLHRFSEHYAFQAKADCPPVEDDFIVFLHVTRDVNDDNIVEKCRTFARLALRHHPVNLGDSRKGGIHRPQRGLHPLAHWKRLDDGDPHTVIEQIDQSATIAAVFRTRADMEAFVRDVKEADLGLSINVSAPVDAAVGCCRAAGITRHSVEYSLGFHGRVERLPDRRVLEISTMCGHGMISHNLVKKLIDWVKEGRRTPAQASRYLERFCTCGVFNPARAETLFDNARTRGY